MDQILIPLANTAPGLVFGILLVYWNNQSIATKDAAFERLAKANEEMNRENRDVIKENTLALGQAVEVLRALAQKVRSGDERSPRAN